MDWFLHDKELRHESVKDENVSVFLIFLNKSIWFQIRSLLFSSKFNESF